MRIAVIGAGRSHRNEAAIVRAARGLGHAALLVDALGWTQRIGRLAPPLLRRRVERFQPDTLLLTRYADRLGEALLRSLARGRYVAFWYFDLRLPPLADVVALGRLADVMFTTYLPQVEVYQAAGVPEVRFLPQGVDPEVDRPATRTRTRYNCDVSFVGSGGWTHRYDLLGAVAGAARLQIRGPGWERAPAELPVTGGAIRGEEFAQVVGGAAISLGAHSLPEMAHQRASASNRMWKVLGCGGFYLGAHVPDIDYLARGGEQCAWYRDATDAVEQVRHYLADPEARQRIATAGHAHALAHHTYAHRLALLLRREGHSLASVR